MGILRAFRELRVEPEAGQSVILGVLGSRSTRTEGPCGALDWRPLWTDPLLTGQHWGIPVGAMAAGVVVAVVGGPGLLAWTAWALAGVLFAFGAARRRVTRVLTVCDGDIVLSLRWNGWNRRVGMLVGPKTAHLSAIPSARQGGAPESSLMEIRLTSEVGRMSWTVQGTHNAVAETELVRGLLKNSGIPLASSTAALQGCISTETLGDASGYSWPAPRSLSAAYWTLAAGFVLALTVGLDSLLDGPLVRVGLGLLSLLFLIFTVSRVQRARTARAWLTVTEDGWSCRRRGWWREHKQRGGMAALPGRVVALRSRRPLGLEETLLTADGAPALRATELSPVEMRWLATAVVNGLQATRKSERAA